MFSNELAYVQLLAHVLRGRMQERTGDDRGASAIEWAVITAIIVAAAIAVATVIVGVVNKHAGEISKF